MTIRTPGEGSVQHRAAAFLHFQRNNQMPSVTQLCSTPSRAPTPAQLVPGPQMPPRRSSATSCTPGKSPFSPSVRKENPAKPTGRIQRENPAPSLDPSRQLSPSPKAASPVYACRRPSLSSGRRSMCPLSQTPFKSKAIQTGQQTLGRLIIRLGSSWPTDSLLSPSPSFLAVGVTWGTSLSGSSPPGLPAGGGGVAKTPAEPG